MRRFAGLAEACGLAVLLALVFACAFHPLYAVDFFWHLKLGEVIAQTGTIPRQNLFSAAGPERPYVQFNWLWELGAAEVVRHFGLRGVRFAQALLMVATFAGLYAVARRSLGLRAELSLAVTALGLVWFEDRFQERPASLVLGFVVVLAPWVLGGYRRAGKAAFVVIGVLGVLWSNLHGGESLLLPLSWLAVGLGDALQRRPSARRAIGLLAVSVSAVLLSPTFLPGLTTWIGTIGAQVQAGNEEWQPAYRMLEQGWRPSFVLIALGPSLVAFGWGIEQWRRYRRDGLRALDLGEVFLCAGLLVLAHHAVRNVFLALVPVLFVLRRIDPLPPRSHRLAFVAGATALALIAVEDALLYSYGGGDRVAEVIELDLAPDAFPEAAAQFAREAGLEGGLVNDGRWGGYLIWRLWPACHVFADSRHHFTDEMWKVFRQSHDALQRVAALEHAHRSWGTELAMFRGPTFPLGAPPNYRLLYKAGDQELYQDLRGTNAAANLERTQRWLARQGVRVPDDPGAPELPELARRVGADRYLNASYVRGQRLRALREVKSPSAAVRGKAHQRLAGLYYRTGDYEDAAREFEHALQDLPGDPVLHYQSAQNTFASGDHPRAEPMLQALLRGPPLAPRQRRRVEAMLAAARR